MIRTTCPLPHFPGKSAFAVLLLGSLVCRAGWVPEDGWRYAPEIEARMAELMGTFGEEKGRRETVLMKEEVSEIGKATGLDGAGQQALTTAGAAAAGASGKDWARKAGARLRKEWEESSDLTGAIEEAFGMVADYVTYRVSPDWVAFADQPAWKEALERILSPPQSAAWRMELAERDRQFDEDTKALVAACRDQAREMNLDAILGTVSAMMRVLSLDDNRVKRLEEIARKAAEAEARSLDARTRSMLKAMDPRWRSHALKDNSVVIPLENVPAAERQSVWTDGLAEILTAGERARWEAAVRDFIERRTQAMARVCVAFLDELIRFTTAQRESVMPLVERACREQKELVPRTFGADAESLPHHFRRAGGRLDAGGLAEILDPQQMKRWREVCWPAKAGRTDFPSFPAKKAEAVAAAIEPEVLDAAVSDHIHAASRSERQRELENSMLRAGDVIHVAGVDLVSAKRLRTAARGSAESQMAGWRTTTADEAQEHLQAATPADLRVRLRSWGFDRSIAPSADPENVWDRALSEVLTPAQRSAWEKHLAARASFREGAITAAALVAFDRLRPLTPEQWAAIEPVLIRQIKKYGPDMDQSFSEPERGEWFCHSANALLPIACFPEKEMRDILGDAQWKAWSSSEEYADCSSTRNDLESNHKERIENEN